VIPLSQFAQLRCATCIDWVRIPGRKRFAAAGLEIGKKIISESSYIVLSDIHHHFPLCIVSHKSPRCKLRLPPTIMSSPINHHENPWYQILSANTNTKTANAVYLLPSRIKSSRTIHFCNRTVGIRYRIPIPIVVMIKIIVSYTDHHSYLGTDG
jgi:hypothetical protein